MPITVQVDDRAVRIKLNELSGALANLRPLLNTIGLRLHASVMKTFDEQGSPAGSWPKLAISTLRNRKYTSGHKLLQMRGDLKGSIRPSVQGNDTVVLGTNLRYAAVHQFGSTDYRGAFTGPFTREQQAAYDAERVAVRAHIATRLQRPRYGREMRTDKNGRTRSVRVRLNPGAKDQIQVRAHRRHQNIPPRPYLVFRPEDPSVIAETVQAYFAANVGAR